MRVCSKTETSFSPWAGCMEELDTAGTPVSWAGGEGSRAEGRLQADLRSAGAFVFEVEGK